MITAVELKTEYLNNPLGIDIARPRVFWKVRDAVSQRAYQIRMSVNESDWKEMPTVESDDMWAHLNREFHSRDRVRYQVRLTDQDGVRGEWSEIGFFEMGLLNESDWQAKWIMGNYNHSKKGKVRYPVDCFCREFDIEGDVSRARLYISACGIYETVLNGSRVGDQVLTPGSTAFQKRVHYQTYDVTDYLDQHNEWKINLGDGFYSSDMGAFDKAKPFGYEPKVFAQLEIELADKTIQRVTTDEAFHWSNDGEVRYADMKNGEIVDYNYIPTYSGYAKETIYDGIVCCSNSNPVREKEHFEVQKIINCQDGHKVLDFGQNIAGYVQAQVAGETGHKCSMVFGEKLDVEGNFTYKNISAKGEYDKCHFQTVDIICDGKKHVYKPNFSVMGFQYVLLLDWPEDVRPEDFVAIAVYSDMEETFEFDSSDDGLNQIVKNTYWSVKGNFLDVPTDCPTRERAGWTGDAQLFYNTGNYMMDQRAFFRKWLKDVADGQKENGMIYNTNPTIPGKSSLYEWVSMEGSAGWGDAMIIIPYYFLQDGDMETDRMCKYVRPCGLNLVEGQIKKKLLAKIVKLNRDRNYKIGTGFLTTPFVFEMLTEAGASDDAYETLMNPDFGWMQQVNMGATTIWENWTSDASLNHYSKGACCQWIFDCVCGVKLDGRRNHFVIEPHIVSQLESVSFKYRSIYGTVSSFWEKIEEKYIFKIKVPDNCHGDIFLPGKVITDVSAGEYEYTI